MTDNSRTVMPKLRFPEFQTNWETKRLDAIAQPITERAGNRPITPYTVTTGVGLISQQDRYGRTIAGSAFKNYYVLRKDDFAYNKSATKAYPQGYIARFLNDEGAVPNSIFTCFRVDPDAMSPAYVDYLFAGNLHGRWLRRFIEVSARAHGSLSIDDADLMSLPVPVPEGISSLAEQRKIAACLTSLDECIAVQARKLRALQAHKKGLMQELFPREGETRPRLRFPTFRDAPEWKVHPLGDLLSRAPEYGVNAPAAPYSPGLPTYIRITDIDDDGNFLTENRASVDVDAADENYLADGDIVLARTGASVGKSYRYRLEDGRLVFAGFLIRVAPDKNRLDSDFLRGFLCTRQYWDWVLMTSARSGQPGISATEYASLPIPVPPKVNSDERLAEQQRIAACLSSLDVVIAAQSRKLDGLRAHKKGLMQQLFPWSGAA